MMVEVKPFDPSQHIEALEDVLEYLRAASEVEDDGSHLASAALDVVRALSGKPKGRMMAEVTQEVERVISKFIANAKIEGARLALEAAKTKIRQFDPEHYSVENDDGDMICSIIADDLATLDPAKIVGEG